MKSLRLLVLGLIALALVLHGAQGRTLRLFNGLASVNVPPGTQVKRNGPASYLFLRPSVGGFRPNVNVLAQPTSLGIRGYAALSKRQFRGLGFQVIYQRFYPRALAWDVEYRGVIGSRFLHFYSRAFQVGGGIVLWTATDLESEWNGPSTNALMQMIGSARVR